MQHRRRISIVFYLGLAVLVGVACNTSTLAWLDSAEVSAPAETPQQSSTTLQTVESGLDQLSSYRADYQISYDGVRDGQRIAGEVIQTVLVDGQLRNISQVITSSSPGIRQVEFTETEDKVIVRKDEDQFWFERGVVPSLTPGDVGVWPLQRLILLPNSARSSPQTDSWNGSPVQSFTFNEADLTQPQYRVEQARGALQINPNGNYLVKYSLTSTVEVAVPLSETHLIDRGKLSISYTLSQPNATKISRPADENTAPNTLAGLPRPEDARITAIYPALLEYRSVISPISATLFYGDELSELGWTQTLTDVFNEKARLGFQKGEERMSVIVLPDIVTGTSKITLSLNR